LTSPASSHGSTKHGLVAEAIRRHFWYLLESNGREALELLEADLFTFKENSSMVIFILRVNLEETLLLDSMSSEVVISTVKGANKLKQRNRETKLVLSIEEQATVFVWPRDHSGIPLPTNMPRGYGHTSSYTYSSFPTHRTFILLSEVRLIPSKIDILTGLPCMW